MKKNHLNHGFVGLGALGNLDVLELVDCKIVFPTPGLNNRALRLCTKGYSTILLQWTEQRPAGRRRGLYFGTPKL